MNQYMQICKELAEDNIKTKVGGPFGACVVKDGKIIGRGSNHVIKNNDPTAHAEIMAIREACDNIQSYDLFDCEIYTSCFPCPMCLSAIIWANIKTVYYGNTKEDAANIGFRDDYIYEFIKKLSMGDDDNNIVSFQMMDREETIQTFEKYKDLTDKIIY